MSQTHREGERITDAIRRELKDRDLLAQEDRKISQLVTRSLTEAERAEATSYQPGDVIVFQQNAPGHRRGERIALAEAPADDLLKLAGRFQVYRSSDVSLAAGDLVRITVNGMTPDKKHRLNNGAVYQLVGFTPEGDLRLKNGWVVPAGYGFLAPGYVATSHASQGRTVDRVLIGQSSLSYPASSREQFYVSVSRGRRQAVIYTDDKSELRQAIRSADSRVSATELMKTQSPKASLLSRMASHLRLRRQQEPPRHKLPEREHLYGS